MNTAARTDQAIEVSPRRPSDPRTPLTAALFVPIIREAALRDPRYPVHKIADKLLPYLRVLVEQFHPEQVILFGSYAYGQPDEHSDVDLLVVKPIERSPVKDATAIRRSWRPIRWAGNSLPIDILVEDGPGHSQRISAGGAFYSEIVHHGLRLA